MSTPESLWVLDPCEVVTDERAVAEGYDSKQRFQFGTTTSCEYSMTSAPAITLTITFSEIGIHELRPDPSLIVASQQVGTHTVIGVKSLTEPMCTVTVGVGETETVSVQAKRVTAEAACLHATTIAEQVEPLLP